MSKFDKIYLDKKFKYALIFISFSLINIFLSFYLKDIYVFLTREAIMCFILLFYYFYSDELAALSQEDEHIRLILKKKYFILRLEFPLLVGSFLGLFIYLSLYFYPDCVMIGMIALIICFAYSVLVFYSVFCIFETPEARGFYDIKRSISQYGIWSFSTFSKVFHICKLCVKVGAAIAVCTWVIPAFANGDPAHRGDLWNILTYPYTGMKARNGWDIRKANYLFDRYPDDRLLVMQKDGCTLDILLLDKQMKARDVDFPFVNFEVSQ